jgi:hypothetical protein
MTVFPCGLFLHVSGHNTCKKPHPAGTTNRERPPVLAPWSSCSRMMREKDDLKAQECAVSRQRRN